MCVFLTTVNTWYPCIVSLSLVHAVVVPVWKYVIMKLENLLQHMLHYNAKPPVS